MLAQNRMAEDGIKPIVILGDIVAGGAAAIPVAPLVSAVDRALAENASGRATLGVSVVNSLKEMAMSPLKFLRGPQFAWIWLVYGATYATANSCQTICDVKKQDVKIPKLLSTFVVNTTTCIAKDRAFAKLYGTVVRPVPPAAYAVWLARDIGSMAVFFTLPPIVGEEINRRTGKTNGYTIAQIGLPLVFQTIFTPIHLLGYNIYNNPDGTVKDRIAFLKKDYFKNVGMRMMRQAPPWSFGTLLNNSLRKTAHKQLE